MPLRRTYHGSRIQAAMVVTMLSVFTFFFVHAIIVDFTRSDITRFAIPAVLTAVMLLVMWRYPVMLLRNPVWLEFGPDGIGGYLFKGMIPWNRVKSLSVTRLPIGDGEDSDVAYLDVRLLPEYGRSGTAPGKKPRAARIRIALSDLKGAGPTRIYRELLHAFTLYADSSPMRAAFPKRGGSSKIPLILIITAACLALAASFTDALLPKCILFALIALDIGGLIVLYLLLPDLVRDKAAWLDIGPDGLGGPAIGNVIPWRDIEDIGVVESERDRPCRKDVPRETRLVVQLSPFSAHAPPQARRKGIPGQLILRVDRDLFHPHIPQLALDSLTLFARYSKARATQAVPERLASLLERFAAQSGR